MNAVEEVELLCQDFDKSMPFIASKIRVAIAELEAEVAHWKERFYLADGLKDEAEAALAERERMLRLSFEDAYPMHGDTYDSGGIYKRWLADLKARAEEKT